MNTITVTLSHARLEQLLQIALRFQISPEDLVRIGVEELLTMPEDAFQKAVSYVLDKNVELNRRLA